MLLHVAAMYTGYARGTVLHNIHLHVASGTVHAIVGHNGAGKTTLLHTIAGLHRPHRGQIQLRGQPITRWPTHRRVRAGIALVPQGRRVWASLTVAEHLAIAHLPRHAEPTWTRSRVLELLPQLAARLSHRGAALSGGEQQMLAIARALLTQPNVLLLDEPTEGLAPTLTATIRDLIATLARQHLAILLAAPTPHLALAVADHISVLSTGRLTGTLDANTARADPAPLHAALSPTTAGHHPPRPRR